MRLIPAIDLKAGCCVRLLHGDFDVETRYEAPPLELLAKYHGFGADWLHVVDLDGPIFLSSDRSPSVRYEDGLIRCPSDLWGWPGRAKDR